MKKIFLSLFLVGSAVVSNCLASASEQSKKRNATSLLRDLIRLHIGEEFEEEELQWIALAKNSIDEYGADITHVDTDGHTALTHAIDVGKPKMFSFLLQRDPGAILREFSPYGWGRSGDSLWFSQERLQLSIDTLASLKARNADARKLKSRKAVIKKRTAIVDSIQKVKDGIMQERKAIAIAVDDYLAPVLSKIVAEYAAPLC